MCAYQRTSSEGTGLVDEDKIQINKPPRKKLPMAVLVLLAGVVVVAGLFLLKPAPRKMPPREPPAPQVTVVYADPAVQALKVTSQGTVAPRREIDLVVQVSGKVVEVNQHFVEGGFFNAGEPLLKIDPRDYELALVRAKARVAEANQALATERGRARQAQREWRDLGNDEANQLFLRKPQLAAAEANLAAAEADLDKAKLDLERTIVTAPFAGRVREAQVDLGQYVTPGNRVGRVYDIEVAEIRLPITDKQASLVDMPLGFQASEAHRGPAVLIRGTIAGETYVWQGHIARTDASVDVNNRMYYAVAEVVDPFIQHPEQFQVPLIIGLFVEAEISGRDIADVIQLPRRAVFKNNRVYVLNEKNQLETRIVRVLMTDRDNAWVKGDIEKGQAVVVGGQNFLTPGMDVSPQPSAEAVAVAPLNTTL
ncbi:efflux RND transporter periplasmic adaptor subunit [Aurantivibrio plasticivorans]